MFRLFLVTYYTLALVIPWGFLFVSSSPLECASMRAEIYKPCHRNCSVPSSLNHAWHLVDPQWIFEMG